MTNYAIPSLSLAAGIALLAAGCGPERRPGIQIDPVLARYITADALAVAGIHLDQLQKSSLYMRHKGELQLPGTAGDMRELLLVWDGKGLLTGGLGAAGKQVSLSGDPRAVQAGTQAAKNGTGKLPNELRPSLDWLPATDPVWLASRGLPLEGVPMRSEYASLLSNFRGHVRSTAAGLGIDSGLHLRARIDCVSETGSRRIDDALRAAIGIARIRSTQNERELYDAIHVKRSGVAVFIDADLSPEASDRLLARLSPARNH